MVVYTISHLQWVNTRGLAWVWLWETFRSFNITLSCCKEWRSQPLSSWGQERKCILLSSETVTDQVMGIMFFMVFSPLGQPCRGVKPMAAAQARDYEKYRYMSPLFSYVFEMLKVLWEVYDREVGECYSRKSSDPNSRQACILWVRQHLYDRQQETMARALAEAWCIIKQYLHVSTLKSALKS